MSKFSTLALTVSSLLLYFTLHSTTLSATSSGHFHDASSGLDFVKIPAGSFIMGNSDLAATHTEMPKSKTHQVTDETPAHTVSLKRDFYLASTEVTQQVWQQIMKTRPGPDAHWQRTDWQQLPVVSVSWDDVQDFIRRLNASASKYRYRLPTEAEWEYAARAGNTGLRPFSLLEMDEHAWYILSSNDEIQTVAKLEPNAFGLYDMLGNVWEWVADWYQSDNYSPRPQIDPQGPAEGDKKVRRGGSYHCPAFMIRPAYRAADAPDMAYSVVGFRLVAEPR